MSSSSVAKQQGQQVSQPEREARLESKESSASANASVGLSMTVLVTLSDSFSQAGLNLNVFGALSGVFSGKSNKDVEADGSSTEQKEEQSHLKGK